MPASSVPRVAMNLSVQQLRDPGLRRQICAASWRSTSCRRSAIEFEMNESRARGCEVRSRHRGAFRAGRAADAG